MVESKLVKSSIKWSGLLMISSFISKFGVKLILAKLLFPEDFGLIAICFVVVTFAEILSDFGFTSVIIQKNIKNDSPVLSSVFWFNILISIILYLVIYFLIAPMISQFYEEALIEEILAIISIQILINPFFFIKRIILNRDLEFKKIFKINISSIIIGASVAIVMAFYGYGIWSIVFQSISTIITSFVLHHVFVKWMPNVTFSFNELKKIFQKSIYDFGTRLTGFFSTHSQIIILTSFLSLHEIGLFSFALMFTTSILDPVLKAVKKVFLPFFSKIQNNTERIKFNHLVSIKYTIMFFCPYLIFNIFYFYDFLVMFDGEKWIESVISIQLLSIVVFLRCLDGTPNVIIKSLGQFNQFFYLQLIRSIVLIVSMLIGVYLFELRGLLISMILAQIILNYISYRFIKEKINITLKEIIFQIKPSILFILSMSLISFSQKMISNSNTINLIFGVILCVIVYLLIYVTKYKTNLNQQLNE